MTTTYVQDAYPSNATFTFNDGIYTYDSSSAQFPVYVPMVSSGQGYPMQPVAEKLDDSPLAWLRREVEEICDFATAA